MYRTTVMLPSNLKTKTLMAANKEGISLGEFIREALKAKLNSVDAVVDPFFTDKNYYNAKTPADLSLNHDDYLYGE